MKNKTFYPDANANRTKKRIATAEWVKRRSYDSKKQYPKKGRTFAIVEKVTFVLLILVILSRCTLLLSELTKEHIH